MKRNELPIEARIFPDNPNKADPSRNRALLVEDDMQVMNIVQMMLSQLGYDVIQTDNGKEAIAKFETYKNDVAFVLTDLDLQDVDGRAVCRAIKDLDPAMKVILSSGYADPSEHGVDFDHVLLKPFSMKQLLAAIDS